MDHVGNRDDDAALNAGGVGDEDVRSRRRHRLVGIGSWSVFVYLFGGSVLSGSVSVDVFPVTDSHRHNHQFRV